MSFFEGGLGELGKGLARVRDGAQKGRLSGLRLGGEHVLGVSNEQVPHEEGDLERSGGVSQDERSGLTAISYDTDYAVKQHEDESLHHDAGRNAKFLENALLSERQTVLAIVAEAIRKELGA